MIPVDFFGVYCFLILLLSVGRTTNHNVGVVSAMMIVNKMDSSKSSTRFITNKMCPYAQKVWIALETLEVSYNMEEISLYGSGGKPDWFLKLNPKGTVPVLVVGQEASMKSRQRCFTDSDEILTQLGKDALPGGSKLCPTEKEMKITEFRSKMNQFLPIGKRAVLGGNKDSMWSTLVELDRLIEGPHICGDIVTIADCAAFPFLWRIENEFGDLDKKGCHKIKAWLTTCKGNDAFSTTIQKSWWWWW